MNPWLKKAMSLVTAAALAAPMLYVSTSVTTANAAPIKIGVALTYNNTPFWSAYISYEQQFAKQLGVQLIGPLVCCDTYGSNAPLQNQQVKDLVNEGAQAVVLNPEDASAMGPASNMPPPTTSKWSRSTRSSAPAVTTSSCGRPTSSTVTTPALTSRPRFKSGTSSKTRVT